MTVSEMFFKKEYNRELFVNDFLDHFLEDGIEFSLKKHEFGHKVRVIKEAWEIGKSHGLDLHVFEIRHSSEKDPRVTLSKEAFLLMQERNLTRALMIFVSANSPNYRFSLLTIDRFLKDTSVQYTFSNPRRYSYFLGPDAKVKTPYEYLVKKGPVSSFEELVGDKEKKIKGRFSVEVVNKEFFNEIGGLFTRLVGGKRKINTKIEDFGQGELKYPSSEHRKQQEFAVRLIGRIIFLWFLKKKGGDGNPLIPDAILSTDAVKEYKERFSKNGSYYHDVLEPLFFEVLRYDQSKRKERVRDEFFRDIPFLNGGLFEPHDDDYYDIDEHGRSKIIGNFHIPDSWFSDFFEILETYNFTIDENTEMDIELSVDPEMLGRIFENLLAEINPETQESARKSTGSYYTPRPIVNFMVDESLRAYLKENVPIDHDLIDFLFDVSLSEDDANALYSIEDRKEIIIALDKIKILDPACGSGAFPMGVMQKIVEILQTIDPDNKVWKEYKFKENASYVKENIDYLRKIGIIRDNIYGVDIQPMAVEISKLRFFLSLIVDEDLESGGKNKGLKPLPNLDFKFACANTLIDIEDNETQMIGEEKEEYEKNINDLKSSMKKYFFVSDHDEKKRIQKDIESIVDAIIETKREHFEDLMKGITGKIARGENVSKKDTDRLEFLRSQKEMWESYKNIFKDEAVQFFNTALLFPDVENGFDIVIGNPPYIKEYVNRSAFDGLRDSPYYKGKMDLWYMFACKGVDILMQNGILTLIAQNNWVTSSGASKMRNKIIKDTKILSLIDFGEYKIFPAGIQTMVMVFKKDAEADNYTFDYRKLLGNDLNIDDVLSILNKKKIFKIEYLTPKIQRDKFLNIPLTFSPSNIKIILVKISDKSDFSLDPKKEVAQGIVCPQDYLNSAGQRKLGEAFKVGDGIFTLSTNELKSLRFSKTEFDLIKPFYTTDELNRWKANPHNRKWIIYTDSKFKDKKKIESYPNIKKHLDKFKKIITSDNRPYGLHRARNENFFKGEKVIAVRKCTRPTFTYVDFDSYVSATFYVIKTERINQKYLVGVLNSLLIEFWLRHKGKMQGANFQIDKEPLLNLPLVKAKDNTQKEVAKLVDQILTITEATDYLQNPQKQAKVNELEREIDQLVYEIYGLTEEEIKIVEGEK